MPSTELQALLDEELAKAEKNILATLHTSASMYHAGRRDAFNRVLAWLRDEQ